MANFGKISIARIPWNMSINRYKILKIINVKKSEEKKQICLSTHCVTEKIIFVKTCHKFVTVFLLKCRVAAVK